MQIFNYQDCFQKLFKVEDVLSSLLARQYDFNTFLVSYDQNTRYQNENSTSEPSGDDPWYVNLQIFNYQDCFQKLFKVENVLSLLFARRYDFNTFLVCHGQNTRYQNENSTSKHRGNRP